MNPQALKENRTDPEELDVRRSQCGLLQLLPFETQERIEDATESQQQRGMYDSAKKVENGNTAPFLFLFYFPLLIDFFISISPSPPLQPAPRLQKCGTVPVSSWDSALYLAVLDPLSSLSVGDVRLRNWTNRLCITLRKKQSEKPFKKNRCSFRLFFPNFPLQWSFHVNFGLGAKNLILL